MSPALKFVHKLAEARHANKPINLRAYVTFSNFIYYPLPIPYSVHFSPPPHPLFFLFIMFIYLFFLKKKEEQKIVMSAYTFDANNVPIETDYIVDALGNEIYPNIANTDLVLGNRYAKLFDGSEIYPRNSIGKQIMIGLDYARDVNQNPYYPVDQMKNEYGVISYIVRQNKEIYPLNKHGGMVSINDVYAKDDLQTEIYPLDDQSEPYILNATYAMTFSRDEYYPSRFDGSNIFVSNKYAVKSTGDQFFPKNSEGHEITVSDTYPRLANGGELYPFLKGDHIQYAAVKNTYAKNSAQLPFYPSYKDSDIKQAVLIVAPTTAEPKIIDNTPMCYLHKEYTVSVNNSKYIIALAPSKAPGDLYVTVMTGKDPTTYAAWKILDPQLPQVFKKVSYKRYRNQYDIFKRDSSSDYFIYEGGVEVLVKFDKKRRLHRFVRDANQKKIYYFIDSYGNRFEYENLNKILYKHDNRPVFSNHDNLISYYEEKGDDLQLFTVTAGVRQDNSLLSGIKIKHQFVDDDNYIYSRTSKGHYCWVQNRLVVHFDFSNKKQTKHFYNLNTVDNTKNYFEWNGPVQRAIQKPTVALNENVDAEENILSFHWQFRFNFYIAILFVILAIVYAKLFHRSNVPLADRFK